MKIIAHFIIVLLLLSGCTGTACAAPQAYKVSSQKLVEYPAFLNDISLTNVVFIGEIHDNMTQHENQLAIIKSLYARNENLAIGLEQFTCENQAQLDAWTSGRLDEQAFKPVYARNWTYDWRYYREIFLFAREKSIPMIALNVPQSIATRVLRQGSAALSDADRKLIPPGMSWSLNPTQIEYFKEIRKSFGNRTPPYPIANFNEAQALRDTTIAWNIAKYADKHPKDTVVVLAGTWHAIKTGVPEQLQQFGKLTYKVILPQSPAFIIENFTTDQTDYFLLK